MSKISHSITCMYCKEVHSVEIYPEDLDRFEQGVFAQKAFPYLSPGERELFISQTCEPCFDEIMCFDELFNED